MTLFDFLDKYHHFFAAMTFGAFVVLTLTAATWMGRR